MALNASTTNSKDDIRTSAQTRHIPRDVAGNFFCDLFLHRYRHKTFLQRNMTRALTEHENRLTRPRRSVTATARPGSRLATVANNLVNGDNAPQHKVTNGTLINGVNQQKALHDTAAIKAAADVLENEHDTSIPASKAISRNTLQVRMQSENYDSGGRRSLRQSIGKAHEGQNAVLTIDLRNIRKKLNWKTNKPQDDVRPRKRARLETSSCHAHLSIWDNTPGKEQQDPLVNETEFCEIITPRAEIDPVVGKYLELKLEYPFVIPARKLRVPVKKGNETVLDFAANYFLEIKLVPTRPDGAWPPVPLLGKSEGEQISKLGALVKEKLQDSLILRYQHLPQPPEAESPLSVFFLNEGYTFRTKYGVEVDAKWIHPEQLPPRNDSSQNPLLAHWAIDDDDRPLGRTNPTPEKSVAKVQRAVKSNTATNFKKPAVPGEPMVTYKVDPSKANGAPKEFRNMLLKGFKCPACPELKFRKVERLLLHLETAHHKYRFHLEDTETTDSRVTVATIRIEIPEPSKPRNPKRSRDEKAAEEFAWVAPSEPFDIQRHVVEGDRSWLGVDHRPKLRKQSTVSFAPNNAIVDPRSAIRKENDGHLPYQHVQPFRSDAHPRKKYPNVRLRTVHESQSTPYTSISHRPVIPEDPDENARSETDDEFDDTWYIARHLENVDLYARKNHWSDARRRLEKKWSNHILHREAAVHTRYQSDSLIRFVRMNKKWIRSSQHQGPNGERLDFAAELENMMLELKERGVINDAVCTDIFTILYGDEDVELLDEEKRMVTEDQMQELENRKAVKQQAKHFVLCKLEELPSDICGACRKTIKNLEKAVRCSNLGCETVAVYYHAKCAGLDTLDGQLASGNSSTHTIAALTNQFLQRRREWKCEKCRIDKGKGPAAPAATAAAV